MLGSGWRLIPESRVENETDIDTSIASIAAAIISGSDALEAAGRYNPPRELIVDDRLFKVIYLSGSAGTAHMEVRDRSSIMQHILLEFKFSLNDSAVLDLTNSFVHHDLGVTREELVENWHPINFNNRLSKAQQIGITTHEMGSFEALKVPSAKDPNGYSWVIFPDRLQSESTISFVSFDRFPYPNRRSVNQDDTPDRNRNLDHNDSEDANNRDDDQENLIQDLRGGHRLE